MVRPRVTLISSWLPWDGNETLLISLYGADVLPPPESNVRLEPKCLRLEHAWLLSAEVFMGCSFQECPVRL